MPTVDRFSLLRRAVTSVTTACTEAGCTYEIIVVDGARDDAVRDWVAEQDHIVYVPGDRGGAVAAANAGFAEAQGQHLLILNDDSRLRPHAIREALDLLDADPMIGQVAFEFLERGSWRYDHFAGVGIEVYANFGITRRTVARAVARITGGVWAPHYRTYGADVELSAWVRRLGYTIATVDRGVEHDYAEDETRRKNEADETRHSLTQRWSSPDQARFRGEPPNVGAVTLQRLRAVERGEDRATRIARLHLSDPDLGKLPLTAPVRPERVVASYIITPDDPQACLGAAMRKLGSEGYACVDWLALPDPETRARAIVDACRRVQPTFVFLQVQGAANLPLDIGRRIREVVDDPTLVIATWNGDVIANQDIFPDLAPRPWQLELGGHVDLSLFSGTGQVEIMRRRGLANAAYLQIGYDVDRYYPADPDAAKIYDVAFLGQNYVGEGIRCLPGQGVDLRRDVVQAFERSGLRLFVGGSGWGSDGVHRWRPLAQVKAGDVYRRSRMAIVVSASDALARYASDRLLRTMACGCVPLVKHFPDFAGLGLRDRENVIMFEEPGQAVELARHYLARPDELAEIGRRGAALVREHHTWEHRTVELSAILHDLRGIRR